jgi:hypothetical protein
MSHPTLQHLERDVEASRAKLARDLSLLRSPDTYTELTSDLKSDALDVKDALVETAKANVQSTIEGFVDDLKARAAANPAAALAIGAGIAWRLIQRPPIASALVGAGLYSLFRTRATHPLARTNEAYLSQAKERLSEQASDFGEVVRERAVELGERVVGMTTELASDVKDRALAMGEKAGDLVGVATERGQELSEEVRSNLTRAVGDAASGAMQTANNTFEDLRQSTGKAAEQVGAGAQAIENGMKSFAGPEGREARDQVLLGAAGVAVVAALSIAWQRRSNESVPPG